MSKKQLAKFFTKAQEDKNLLTQIINCGESNSCVADVGKKYGHNFSSATVSNWKRDHESIIATSISL